MPTNELYQEEEPQVREEAPREKGDGKKDGARSKVKA